MDIVKLWEIYKPKWPEGTYRVLAPAAAVLLMVLIGAAVYKRRSVLRVLAGYLLFVYLVIVFGSTVFTRPEYAEPNYRLELFWSYRWGLSRNQAAMGREILLNCLMLVPFGLLFPVTAGGRKRWGGWRLDLMTMLGGAVCTLGIEVLQLALRRGLFEFDDMIHNMIGVAAGYLLYGLAGRIGRRKNGEFKKCS